MDIENKIKENISLAPLTTFKIGGPARYYYDLIEKGELGMVLDWAEKNQINAYILGGGSNILVSDEGVNGLVIHLSNSEIKAKGDRLECGGGCALSRAASLAKSLDLSGLEWSVGIPRATIGGAIRGNAEAFGVSMGQIAETVEAYDKEKKKFEILSRRMCGFDYRQSIFKKNSQYIVWSAILKMSPSTAEYIESQIEESLNFRAEHYPGLPGPGSIFENIKPITVEECNKALYDNVLCHKIGREGKISAGYLIDQAGLKGKTIGGVKISLEHANFIVNTGNGKASEVIMMISYIKQQVRDRYNIQLQEEIQYFGF